MPPGKFVSGTPAYRSRKRRLPKLGSTNAAFKSKPKSMPRESLVDSPRIGNLKQPILQSGGARNKKALAREYAGSLRKTAKSYRRRSKR